MISSNINHNNEDHANSDVIVDRSKAKEILDACAMLHAGIMPLNEKIRGPLAKNSDQGTSLPFVFCVGNHSSGMFLSYLLLVFKVNFKIFVVYILSV